MATQEQQDLATVVKGVHSHLRQQVKLGRSVEDVWSEHLASLHTLNTYSHSMHKLATDYWEKAPGIDTNQETSRIQWIYNSIQTYYRDKGLEKQLDKDRRRLERYSVPLPTSSTCQPPYADYTCSDTAVRGSSRDSVDGCDGKICDSTKETCHSVSDQIDSEHGINNYTLKNTESISQRGGDFSNECDDAACDSRENTMGENTLFPRLKVLDVGSCYNPFAKFSDLDVLALDIAPAPNTAVSRCDFLTVDLGSATISSIPDGVSTVSCLEQESFEAVIFCLLLEYLPAPGARFECCKKAVSLLKENGLLLIVTPDSCRQGRNYKQFQSWQLALQTLGLAKVYYEKTQHFHGLAYRKLSPVQRDLVRLDRRPAQLQAIADVAGLSNPPIGMCTASSSHNTETSDDALTAARHLMVIPQDFSSADQIRNSSTKT